jgi:UDP-4-amino-4,6-dideoxy-N-acetyl-beta-L-altrosamine transaminase
MIVQHFLDKSDLNSVTSVLKSGALTQGPVVQQFEEKIKTFLGVDGAVAVNSATSALHLACVALGVSAGDIVWTSANSFAASANCARYCGADVDFIDIDFKTRNVSLQKLQNKLKRASQNGKLPKCVILVHFAGSSCNMAELASILRAYGVRIIEDASHAFGAFYKDERVGSCAYSDLSVFSFHPVKIITTGEGGVITGNDPTLIERLRLLSSHGITRAFAGQAIKTKQAWEYDQVALGFNFRMSDINAALGLSQIDKADKFISKRGQIARRYDYFLRGLDLGLPLIDPGSSWHLYVITFPSTKIRDAAYQELVCEGFYANVHYKPIHLMSYYRALGFKSGMFPMAEKHYKTALTLPLFPVFKKHEQVTVVDIIKSVLGR